MGQTDNNATLHLRWETTSIFWFKVCMYGWLHQRNTSPTHLRLHVCWGFTQKIVFWIYKISTITKEFRIILKKYLNGGLFVVLWITSLLRTFSQLFFNLKYFTKIVRLLLVAEGFNGLTRLQSAPHHDDSSWSVLPSGGEESNHSVSGDVMWAIIEENKRKYGGGGLWRFDKIIEIEVCLIVIFSLECFPFICRIRRCSRLPTSPPRRNGKGNLQMKLRKDC